MAFRTMPRPPEPGGAPSELSRRRLLVGGTLPTVAAGLGFAGCSRCQASAETEQERRPLGTGGDLIVAFDGAGVFTIVLDPHNSGYAPHNKVVDAEIIGWLREAAREPDGPGRLDYYRQVQRKILDKTYAIPIYVLFYNLAVAQRVRGVGLDAHGFPEFYDARLEA
jgi:ABC-type transport system substrate-binding protein